MAGALPCGEGNGRDYSGRQLSETQLGQQEGDKMALHGVVISCRECHKQFYAMPEYGWWSNLTCPHCGESFVSFFPGRKGINMHRDRDQDGREQRKCQPTILTKIFSRTELLSELSHRLIDWKGSVASFLRKHLF